MLIGLSQEDTQVWNKWSWRVNRATG